MTFHREPQNWPWWFSCEDHKKKQIRHPVGNFGGGELSPFTSQLDFCCVQ